MTGYKKRSNSLYRAPPSGKSAPDEENIFIHGEESFGYHPQKGCYPDLYNHFGDSERTMAIEKRDEEYGYRTLTRVFALIFSLMFVGVFIIPTAVTPGHFTPAGYVVAAIWLIILVVTGFLACLGFLWFAQYSWEAIVAVALFALWGIADLNRRRRARGHDE